jgi:hypothetical protein
MTSCAGLTAAGQSAFRQVAAGTAGVPPGCKTFDTPTHGNRAEKTVTCFDTVARVLSEEIWPACLQELRAVINLRRTRWERMFNALGLAHK